MTVENSGEIKDGAAAEDLTLLGMEDALEMNLDDVEDLPDFVNPPTGAYKLGFKKIGFEKYNHTDKETKQKSKRARLRITYVVKSTVQLADGKADKVADGSLFSETFQWPDGAAFFKRHANALLGKENIKGVPMKDITGELLKLDDLEATVSTKSKASGDSDKEYTNTNVKFVALFADPDAAA